MQNAMLRALVNIQEGRFQKGLKTLRQKEERKNKRKEREERHKLAEERTRKEQDRAAQIVVLTAQYEAMRRRHERRIEVDPKEAERQALALITEAKIKERMDKDAHLHTAAGEDSDWVYYHHPRGGEVL